MAISGEEKDIETKNEGLRIPDMVDNSPQYEKPCKQEIVWYPRDGLI